jgi:chorismate mutase
MKESNIEAQLSLYRKDIDAIDAQILELLKARMNIIEKVGLLKKNSNDKFYIRSNREADMIKNLINLSNNQFPKTSIVNIWRKIITSANNFEQPIKIAVHNPKNISDLNYLTKEYYSNEIPIINYDSCNKIIFELENNNCQIGIFTLPNNDENTIKEDIKDNWWIALANNKIGVKIFALIPFIENTQNNKNQHNLRLIATAIKKPEKSSNDNTIISIETDKNISKTQLISAFKELNINAKILKSVEIFQFDSIKFYLVEIEGFYLENDEIIKKLEQIKFKPFIKILGHFATPIKI